MNACFGGRFEAYCAGVEPGEINPVTKKVMKEIGIDISKQCPKNIDEFRGMKFDCIITLCDYAKTFCTKFPEHKKQLHKSFKEYCIPVLCGNAKKLAICLPKRPPKYSPDSKDIENDILKAFRYLREAIFEWVEKETAF